MSSITALIAVSALVGYRFGKTKGKPWLYTAVSVPAAIGVYFLVHIVTGQIAYQ